MYQTSTLLHNSKLLQIQQKILQTKNKVSMEVLFHFFLMKYSWISSNKIILFLSPNLLNQLIHQSSGIDKYLDNIPCICKGTHRQLNFYLNLNLLSREIKCIAQTKSKKQLHFLDLTFSKDLKDLNFNIHGKPMSTDVRFLSILNWNNSVPVF